MARARTVTGLLAAGGLLALAAAAPAQAAALPTTLTEKAPAVVTYGVGGTVTGHLARSGTGAAVSGQAVTLWFKAPSAKTWTKGVTHTTNTKGNVAFFIRPTRPTDYMLRHAASSLDGASSSAAALVRVAWHVTAVPASSAVAPRAHDSFAVTVAPKAAGAVVTLQRTSGTSWITVKTATLSATSTVTIGITAPSTKGSYTYRVVKAANTVYSRGIVIRTITVT